MTKRSKCARLGVEQLETRSCPAGTVTVTATATKITVVGDAEDNDITITRNQLGGFYTITGNAGTTITGDTGPYPVTAGNEPLFVLDMKDGNDVVLFNSTNVDLNSLTDDKGVFGGLKAKMGRGNDTLQLGDSFLFPRTNFTGSKMVVKLGRGNDNFIGVGVNSVNGFFRKVRGVRTSSLLGGRGADTVDLFDVNFGKLFFMDGGAGADTFLADSCVMNNAIIELGRGRGNGLADVVDCTFNLQLCIFGGRSPDQIFVTNSSIGDHLLLSTRRGGDLVHLEDVIATKETLIVTARGNDTIEFDDFFFNDIDFLGRVIVRCGAGNDTISFNPTLVNPTFGNVDFANPNPVVLNGGGGIDSIAGYPMTPIDQLANFLVPPIIRKIP